MFNAKEFENRARVRGLKLKLHEMRQSDTQNIFDFDIVSKHLKRIVAVEDTHSKTLNFGGNIYLRDGTKRGYDVKSYDQAITRLKKIIDEKIKEKV